MFKYILRIIITIIIAEKQNLFFLAQAKIKSMEVGTLIFCFWTFCSRRMESNKKLHITYLPSNLQRSMFHIPPENFMLLRQYYGMHYLSSIDRNFQQPSLTSFSELQKT